MGPAPDDEAGQRRLIDALQEGWKLVSSVGSGYRKHGELMRRIGRQRSTAIMFCPALSDEKVKQYGVVAGRFTDSMVGPLGVLVAGEGVLQLGLALWS